MGGTFIFFDLQSVNMVAIQRRRIVNALDQEKRASLYEGMDEDKPASEQGNPHSLVCDCPLCSMKF